MLDWVSWLKDALASIGLYTTNDYILAGTELVGIIIILLAYNAWLDYKVFRYY